MEERTNGEGKGGRYLVAGGEEKQRKKRQIGKGICHNGRTNLQTLLTVPP